MKEDYPYLREIVSPVTAHQLRPLSPLCQRVQFSSPLTEQDHAKLARFLQGYPKMQLRAYGHYFEKFDLRFLRHYPFVRDVCIEVFELKDIDGLQHISSELRTFALGQTRSKAHSLAFLERFRELRTLYLEGHTKDIGVIGSLAKLEDLTLRSITLPDLSILKSLNKLLSLDIKLGGTTDLSLLPEIGRLRYLELWMIRGLSDLRPIASVSSLQYLFLQALKNVRELPSLAKLSSLRRVHLQTMKGLTDLQPVAQAPALEELHAIDMPHLDPKAFEPFLGHPTLQRAHIGLGSGKKNSDVKQLLNLRGTAGAFKFRKS